MERGAQNIEEEKVLVKRLISKSKQLGTYE